MMAPESQSLMKEKKTEFLAPGFGVAVAPAIASILGLIEQMEDISFSLFLSATIPTTSLHSSE